MIVVFRRAGAESLVMNVMTNGAKGRALAVRKRLLCAIFLNLNVDHLPRQARNGSKGRAVERKGVLFIIIRRERLRTGLYRGSSGRYLSRRRWSCRYRSACRITW
jgi:hypothetical protein